MRTRRIVAILALVFFFAPLGLRAVGVTARPFENRRMATFPSPSEGWKAIDQATRFFVDRLPLREQAVRANTWASLNIFGTQPRYGAAANASNALPFAKPAEQAAHRAGQRDQSKGGTAIKGQPGITVLYGKRGWLYLEEELGRACKPFLRWPQAIQRWSRLGSIIRSSGRHLVMSVAPDKSTIYPEYLPDAYPEKACGIAGHEQAWAAIDGAPAFLGLRQAMLDIKRPPPDEVYYPKDSHWNTFGGTVAAGKILDALGTPARMRPDEMRAGRTQYVGDLTNLLGHPEKDTSRMASVERPGVPHARWEPQALPGGGKSEVLRHPPGGPPLVPGRTLLVRDSYGVAITAALEPYVRDLMTTEWYLEPPAAIIAAIRRSDTVILETIERDANAKAAYLFTPQFLTMLRRALR